MKVISFKVGETLYGVRMDVINMVIPYPKLVAKIPNQKVGLIGVTHIRGKVSSILDINYILGVPSDEMKYLIVLEKNGVSLCFATVDIPRTIDIGSSAIDSDFMNRSNLLEGVVNIDDMMIVLLDCNVLFT